MDSIARRKAARSALIPFRAHPAVVGGVVALLEVNSSHSLVVAQSRLVTTRQVEAVRLTFDTVQKRGPPQS
jgi:hypothetical protein